MPRPICCGKRVTRYHKSYGRGGWEEGWRCVKCGRNRIPDGTFNESAAAKYHAEMDAIRERAVKEEA